MGNRKWRRGIDGQAKEVKKMVTDRERRGRSGSLNTVIPRKNAEFIGRAWKHALINESPAMFHQVDSDSKRCSLDLEQQTKIKP